MLADTVGSEDYPESSEPARDSEYEPYLAGEVIGDRYRLQQEIGRGGMGVVWIAHSLVLGIDVALKLIRAGVAGPAVASRMAREAHAAARLGHPALVRVFDFGWTSRGDPFLVMELIHGDTLASVIRRDKALPAIRAVQTLLPIVDGLRVAHERSIVHRDIKPDNIVLSSDALGRSQPKLLDFGIAKVGQRGGSAGKITQMGTVLGSPEYMSPEQALGLEDIDARTDVWSVCVALYEMLTGRLPFSKPNYNALMQAIINEQPDPTSKHPEGDALWAVLKKGLQKERLSRWQNMTELGEALALWLYQHGIKEDICGNSIRALWLDPQVFGTDQGVPKEPDSKRLSELVLSERPYLASLGQQRAANNSQQAGKVSVAQAGWRASRRVPVATLAVAAIALGLGIVWGRHGSGDDPSSELVANATAVTAPSADGNAALQMTPTLAQVQPEPQPKAEDTRPPQAPPVASASPRATAARSPATAGNAKTQAKPNTTERRSNTAGNKNKAKLSHDFGF